MWRRHSTRSLAVRWLVVLVAGLSWQACSGDDMTAPEPGAIAVTITTTGAEPDPDGYTLSLDGLLGAPIGVNATRILPVDQGDHTLELAGLAGNCSAGSQSLRRAVTVGGGDTVAVVFEIVCSAAAGGLRVVTATTGDDPDPNAYSVAVGSDDPRLIGLNDTLELAGLEPGDYAVRLLGVAPNCTVSGGDSVTATVTAGDVAEVTFAVLCSGGVRHWVGMESGTTADLADVWGTSGSDVFAVGELEIDEPDFQIFGLILHYGGSSWTAEAPVPDVSLRGVWGSSADGVYAVGFDFFASLAVALHYDAGRWVEQPLPPAEGDELALLAVWGSSASDVYAVGEAFDGAVSRTLILHYDGSKWVRVEPIGNVRPTLNDVWGSSATDVYAVGLNQRVSPPDGVVLHYDGAAWIPVLQEEGLSLNSVWGSSASDVYAAGFTVEDTGEDFIVAGAIRHYDGRTWTAVSIPSVGILQDLWGTSAGDVFAVGENGLVLHYDGTAWTGTNQGDRTLLGVWGSSPSDVFAVGNDGTILHGGP